MTTTPALAGLPRWRIWLLAARPATLPAAIVPVLVGTAAATQPGTVLVWPFAAALVAAVLIQVGTNFANDVFDFLKGADTGQRLGPPRATQTGAVTTRQMLLATYLTFGAALLVGVYLVLAGGWPILAIGLLAIASGLAYTGGPWPLAYHGLGDVFVFVFFGLLGVVGSAYLQTLTLVPLAVAASVPVGFLVTAILVVNNLRDIETDRAVGKRTLAVRLGPRATRVEYAALVVGAYAASLALRLAGAVGEWFWLLWLTLPLGLLLVRTIATSEGPALNRALKQTGQLHLWFGLLLAASLWL